MTLSEFICDNHSAIVQEWEAFARGLLPAAKGMSAVALRDHAEEILTAIVADIESPQNSSERSAKSKGLGEHHMMKAVGKMHAALRIEDGFKFSQLVAEYRALRASVLELYQKSVGKQRWLDVDFSQVARFNEALDEALVEATDRYLLVMNRTSDQFLAVLGRDLRAPLASILQSAATLARRTEPESVQAGTSILTSAARVKRMVNDLLDLTRTRLGSGISLEPEPADLAVLCREAMAELQSFHPDRTFDFQPEGDLRGSWDVDRIAQVLGNLMSNALQHGARESPIRVRARDQGAEIAIEIHNDGPPIPAEQLENIFEPVVRDPDRSGGQVARSLVLGLHIAREVVLTHGGAVTVASTAGAGTTFTVRLPRRSAAVASSTTVGTERDKHDASGAIVAANGEPDRSARG